MSTSGFRTWAAYQKGFALALRVKDVTDGIRARDHRLADQLLRACRSTCANLGEAYGVRHYPKHFSSKVAIAIAENYETQVWLDFCFHAQYLSEDDYRMLCEQSEEIGRLLTYMSQNPGRYKHWKAV